MSAKKSTREPDKPVSLEEVRTGLLQFTNLVKQFGKQFSSPVNGKSYLSDASFVKAQSTLKFLQQRPELFPGVDRERLADNIQNYLDFEGLMVDMKDPLKIMSDLRKAQSQEAKAIVLGVYGAAKSAEKSSVLGVDPEDAAKLVEDLAELFEKAAETRKKNNAIKAKEKVEPRPVSA